MSDWTRKNFLPLKKELLDKARAAGEHARRVHRALSYALASVGFIVSVFTAFMPDLPVWVQVAGAAVLFASLLGLMWLTSEAPLVVEKIGAYYDMVDALERADHVTRYASTLAIWSSVALRLVERRTDAIKMDEAALKEAIREVLVSLRESATGLFGFESDERWSMTVYKWNTADQRLSAVERVASENHPRRNELGRSWGAGEGHVGHAFNTRKVVTTPDATEASFVSLLNVPPSNAKPGDNELYRSYISAPIGGAPDGDAPFGVLVATSDRIGRFDAPSRQPVEFASIVLAAFFRLRHKEV